MAAEGDSLTVSAARVCTSSQGFSTLCCRSDELPCAIDLTTSPLQIGQVLRRLTSHGVLEIVSYQLPIQGDLPLTCNRREIRGRREGS